MDCRASGVATDHRAIQRVTHGNVSTPAGVHINMSRTRPEGFEEFVQAHADSLWRQAWMLTSHRQDAEDLLQETLVRLVLSWARVDPDRQPLAYARTTMARLHVSRWRAARRRVQLVLGRDLEIIDHRSDLSAVENQALIRDLLAALTPRERVVVVLTYLEDLPDEAIAGAIGATTGTVRSLRSRALARLRADNPADTSNRPVADGSRP